MHAVPNHLKVVTFDATNTSYVRFHTPSYILDINIRHHQSCMHEHMTQLNAYVHTNNITTSSPNIYAYMNSSTIHHHSTYMQSPTTFTIQLTYMCSSTTSQSINIYAFTNNIHNSINIYVFINNISIN